MQNACRIFSGLGLQLLYNLYTVNGRCQILLQSTRMGSHPLLMMDVKVYYSQRDGFTPFANGGCQSLLQSTRMGSNPLLMVDVKIYYSQQEWVTLHPLLMVDVKVCYSQQEWVHTLC